MSSQTISLNGESWTIDAPGDVTVADPALNGGMMKIAIDYTDASFLNNPTAHGIDTITFTPVVNDVDSFGFHTPVEIDITNGMSVPIPGFDLMNTDNSSTGSAPYPQNPPGHPSSYAHYHGFSASDFAPEMVQGFLPDFSPAGSNPPSSIVASGTLAPGQTVTATGLELHSEEHAGQDNGFEVNFFLTGGNPPSTPPVITGLNANEVSTGLNMPFAGVTVTDTNSLPVEQATITVRDKVTGQLTDADGLFAGSGVVHTAAPGTYTLNPQFPGTLTSVLDNLTFNATGNPTITLTVDNSGGTGVPAPAVANTNLIYTPPITPPNTIIVTDGPSILDQNGKKWQILKGQVEVNGTIDPTTHRVVALGYANGQVWQENADKNWWSKTNPGDPWAQGSPPAGIANPTLQVSANNTELSVTDPNQTIIDANQNTWSFVNGGQVSINGQIDPQTGHGVNLAYVNGEVWENADNLWWGKTSPTAPWSPPNGQSQSPLTGAAQAPQPALPGPDTVAVTADSLGQTAPSFLQSNNNNSSTTTPNASNGLIASDSLANTQVSAADMALPTTTPTASMVPDTSTLSMSNFFTPPANNDPMIVPHPA